MDLQALSALLCPLWLPQNGAMDPAASHCVELSI